MIKKAVRLALAIVFGICLGLAVFNRTKGAERPEVIPVVESPLPPCPSKVPDTGVTAYVGCDSSIFEEAQ